MFLTTKDCNGSGECVEACPTDAIKLVDGKAVSCITCGKCQRVCPNKAIFKNDLGGYVVDRTKCNTCGMCINVCPVSVITIKDGKLMGLCSNCGVCVAPCPQNARKPQPKRPVKMENDVVNRVNIGTNFEDCIECGRCAYVCPTNSIKFSYIEPGVCTKCDICIDVCTRNAIGPIEEGGEYHIDMQKCAICYKCLIECPNEAIVAEDLVLTINQPDYDVENDTRMISCIECKLCADACPTDALDVINKRLRYQVDKCTLVNGSDHPCAKDIEHAPCTTACPQGVLELIPESKITLEGLCVECSICVKECKYDARKFGRTTWDGEIKPNCIKCGLCIEVCPKDALWLEDGQIKVNFDKCVLCEKCAMYCPVNAIPKTTPLKIKIASGYSMLNNDLCIECGRCKEACPFKAISIDDDGNYHINNQRCIYCGACKTACPARAIKIQRNYEATI